jgi:membrane-associated phospholipid phosphatase
MRFVTDFAEQAVILPVLAAVVFMLAGLGWRRGATAWVVAGGGTLGVILVLKLTFLACGSLIPEVDLHTPSGHTASAAMVAGGMIGFVKRARDRAMLAVLTALAAAAIFGFSRLALGVHSLSEVVVGGIVGSLGALLLVLLAGPAPDRLRLRGLLAVVVVIVVLFHGFHLPAEARIYDAATFLRLWPLSACRI